MRFCDRCGSYMEMTAAGYICPRCGDTIRTDEIEVRRIKDSRPEGVYVGEIKKKREGGETP